jgi:hypothetical protein
MGPCQVMLLGFMQHSTPVPITDMCTMGMSSTVCLFPSMMSPHQEWCKAMEDVGQREKDSRLALQLPLRAVLLHQPPFLWGRRGILWEEGLGNDPSSPSPDPGSPQNPAPH